GNGAVGVTIEFSGNLVQGNLIGTDITGTLALGNGDRGVFVSDGSDNTIGGTTAAARNLLSANGRGAELRGSNHILQGNFVGTDVASLGSGVAIANETFFVGNSIVGNSMFKNSRVCINLVQNTDGSDGATPNDLTPTPDADTGPNNLQNFPVITSATFSGGQLT